MSPNTPPVSARPWTLTCAPTLTSPRRIAAHGVVVHAGMHFSAAVAERMAAARDRLLRAVDYAETGAVSLFFENLNREPDAAEVHYLGHTVDECRYFFDAILSERFRWAFTVNHAPPGAGGHRRLH